jgi:hypothetical protein
MVPSSTSSNPDLAIGEPPAVYVPKPLVLLVLVAIFGFAGAWFFHEAAADAATEAAPAAAPGTPSAPAPSAPSSPEAPPARRLAPPPVPAPPGGPVRVTVAPGSTTHLTVDASTGVVSGDSSTARSTTQVTFDPATGVVSGDSSTPRTTTHIEKTADVRVLGASQARTNAPVIAAPPAPSASPTPVPAAPRATSRAPAAPTPPEAGVATGAKAPLTVSNAGVPSGNLSDGGLALQIPSFFGENLFKPLPGTKTRGIAFSEWESYRTDVAGRNIIVTTDDSNLFRDRNGKLNGNTGDTDASGLNVTGASDSVILGTESADEAPYQTVGQGVVDIATGKPSTPHDPSDDEDEGDDEDAGGSQSSQPTGGDAGDEGSDTDTGDEASVAHAAFIPLAADDEGFDFPYTAWISQVGSGAATAIHTDEGTTLASGQEALVIGGDGYDDDDNRVTGENIVVTRDDGNVVLGGTGDVNAQIGDSEQGAVIMDVTRTFIQGGGAY